MSATPIDPIFDGPPPSIRTSGDQSPWLPTAEALKAKSGEWAIVLKGTYSSATNLAMRIRSSRGAWAGSEWEAATRTIRTGADPEVWVWARHVGQKDGEA